MAPTSNTLADGGKGTGATNAALSKAEDMKGGPSKLTKDKPQKREGVREIYASILGTKSETSQHLVFEREDNTNHSDDHSDFDAGGNPGHDIDSQASESDVVESDSEDVNIITLKADPEWAANRRRIERRLQDIQTRAHIDHEHEKTVPESQLRNVLPKEHGGYYRIFEHEDGGPVTQEADGTFFDHESRRTYIETTKLETPSATPYKDGEIPVKPVKPIRKVDDE